MGFASSSKSCRVKTSLNKAVNRSCYLQILSSGLSPTHLHCPRLIAGRIGILPISRRCSSLHFGSALSFSSLELSFRSTLAQKPVGLQQHLQLLDAAFVFPAKSIELQPF